MGDDTPATFEDGSTTKTIPGEGTYTVAPDGTVTFVPEKSFTGTGTGVTVKRVIRTEQSFSNLHTNCNACYTNCKAQQYLLMCKVKLKQVNLYLLKAIVVTNER